MSEGNPHTLRVMAWNVGFGSRKGFAEDSVRADGILKIVNKLNVDIVALQEMGSAEYSIGLPPFNFPEYLKRSDPKLNSIHFFPTISLGSRHCYPYGKIRELNDTAGVCWLEYGPGIWVRNVNGWHLRNLWSDKNIDRATIEVQRPIPHPLYMGEAPESEGDKANKDKKKYSASRDEEDRPVLWSRIDKMPCDKMRRELKELRVFFLSLHLPTLKNEEKDKKNVRLLNKTQKNIRDFTLSLSKSYLDECLHDKKKYGKKSNIVDVLASNLRLRYLEQVLAQCEYIEEYWKDSQCVFIFAGDFNFHHSNNNQSVKMPEEVFLRKKGFLPAKKSGSSRPGGRLVDNIWVKKLVEAKECGVDNYVAKGVQIEGEAADNYTSLSKISDHYPVVADIELKRKKDIKD